MYPINNADEHPSHSQKFPGDVRSCAWHIWHPASVQDRLFHRPPLLCFPVWISGLVQRGVAWCSLQSPEGEIHPVLQPLGREGFGSLPENSWAKQKHPRVIQHGGYFGAVFVVVWGFFQKVLSVNSLYNCESAGGGFVLGEAEPCRG